MNETMNETMNTRESIPPYLSRKIRFLSFFTIICVVFIHAYNYHDTYLLPTTAIQEGKQICPMIQFFICNALTRFANPLYFFISGYLFFSGARRFNASVYAKKLKIFAVILAAVPWIFDYSVTYMPNCDGILFFVLGAYLAVNCIRFPGKERPVKKTALTIAIPVIWIAVCAAYTAMSAAAAPERALLFVYKACCAFGFMSVFIIYDAASGRIEKSRALAALSSCTFFIYACHEPLQHMIFQRVFEFTDSNFVHMALFFGLPLIFAAFGAALGSLLRKAAPCVHSVLTGGRC